MNAVAPLIRTVGIVLLFWSHPLLAIFALVALGFSGHPKKTYSLVIRVILEILCLAIGVYGFYEFPYTPNGSRKFLAITLFAVAVTSCLFAAAGNRRRYNY
jgi:hypothetical protein